MTEITTFFHIIHSAVDWTPLLLSLGLVAVGMLVFFVWIRSPGRSVKTPPKVLPPPAAPVASSSPPSLRPRSVTSTKFSLADWIGLGFLVAVGSIALTIFLFKLLIDPAITFERALDPVVLVIAFALYYPLLALVAGLRLIRLPLILLFVFLPVILGVLWFWNAVCPGFGQCYL